MSTLFGYVEKETESYIANKKEVKVLTKIKYGGISQLKSIPFLIELSFGNIFEPTLLKHEDIDKLSFSGKVPTNKKRAKSIFELEEWVIETYGSYIPIRLDIELPKYSKHQEIHSSDYISFLEYLRNNLRFNSLKELLAAYFYVIENNKEGIPHLHWYLLLRGDRYLFLSKRDREIQYRVDIDKIIKVVLDYLSYQNTVVGDCTINVVDMSDKGDRNKVIYITKEDYLLRNCARAWFTYVCKPSMKSRLINSRTFGKSVVKKEELKLETIGLIMSIPRLIEIGDYKYISTLHPGVDYHYTRIKDLFELEGEIAREYEKYLFMPFRIIEGDSKIEMSDPALFLKKFNNYRTSVSLIDNSYICYCWMLNQLSGKVEFNFCLFGRIGRGYIENNHDISKIVSRITKWIREMNNSLSTAIVIEPDVSMQDVTYSLDYKQRNKVRAELAMISVSDNEREDMSLQNYRLYSKSRVKNKNA